MIPLRYFLRVNNVGDKLSPTLVHKATGVETVWAHDVCRPHLVGLGSILAVATRQSYIWGSGVMHPSFGTGDLDLSKVLALRGKHSFAEVARSVGPLRDIPLGDPGFLAASLFPIARSSPTYELGLVPHYVDEAHPVVQDLSVEDGVLALDVHGDPDSFLTKLAMCKCVVSSSLHGLVFAEALGIPNLWVKFSDDVTGDGFKFRDWFSLAALPQNEPITLGRAAPVSDLASRCELHEMEIDIDALRQSLADPSVLAQLGCGARPRLHPVSECRKRPIPIFVISFNRADQLRRAVASYCRLGSPVEIIVHDNGSTDAATRATLAELESKGALIYRKSAIRTPQQLENVNETIEDYFSQWAEPARYVVTDCDIDLSIADPDVLSVYDLFLDNFRHVQCVGPMLRIHDIPLEYPLYAHVLNRHIEQFWGQEPQWFQKGAKRIAFQFAAIDTTFAMYRAGERFNRLQPGIRVYHPFEARHLDWYEVEEGASPYRTTSSNEISHWNNEEQTRVLRNEMVRFAEFRCVMSGLDGELSVVTRRVGHR